MIRKTSRYSEVQLSVRKERFRAQNHDSKFIKQHYSSYSGMKVLSYTILTAICSTVCYHILRSANTQAVAGGGGGARPPPPPRPPEHPTQE
jgi:hypothetical protein